MAKENRVRASWEQAPMSPIGVANFDSWMRYDGVSIVVMIS
jgi:hypothetical protein